jgi:diketogulonate reductase-like aldo/keto reductase
MKHVELPDGARVPALGLGTWRLGERTRTRATEVAVLREALELGFRLIDTAEMYGDGGAEEVVGAALAAWSGRRDDVFVVSKVLPSNASRRDTVAACERSLRRLGVDRIDLYLLHWRGSVPLAETVVAFEQLQHDGKIRYWGVSNFDCVDMQALWGLSGGNACAANQIYYAASRRGIEFDLLPWLRERRVPAMAYCPLGEGALARDTVLAEIGRRHGASAAQVAIAWLLTQPNVIPIPKAGNPDHLRENWAAAKLKLTADDLAAIDRRFPPPKRKSALAMV